MPHCTFLHLSRTGVPGDQADRFSQAFLLLAFPQGNIHFLLLLPSEDTSKTLQQGSRSLPSLMPLPCKCVELLEVANTGLPYLIQTPGAKPEPCSDLLTADVSPQFPQPPFQTPRPCCTGCPAPIPDRVGLQELHGCTDQLRFASLRGIVQGSVAQRGLRDKGSLGHCYSRLGEAAAAVVQG